MPRRVFEIAVVLGAATVALTALATPSVAGERRPNEIEAAYVALAGELYMPELCEKISPRAVSRSGFGGKPHQISYTRSDCYLNLALASREVEFCGKVRRKSSLLLGGSGTSEQACLERVKSGEKARRGGHSELIMRLLGHTGDWDASYRAYVRLTAPDRRRDSRELAAVLPDFSANPPLPSDFPVASMGCDGPADPAWFCRAARCLMGNNEESRESCLRSSLAQRSGG